MNTTYMVSHRPCDAREFPEYRADQVVRSGLIPKDALIHPEMYYSDVRLYDGKHVAEILNQIQGNPNMLVRIYRGAPSDGILNTGDWVSLSKKYAEQYAENGAYSDNPNSRVYGYLVKASDLSYDGDSIYEFGYWGEVKNSMDYERQCY